VRIESALYSGPIADAPARLGAPATAIAETLDALHRPAADLTVRIDGSIPAGRGLGSSAAVASAISAGIAAWAGEALDEQTHFRLIQAAEAVAHGSASGLDARAVVADAPIRFRAGRVQTLPVAVPATFVIADTGVPGATREAVAAVAELLARDESGVHGIIDGIAAETQGAEQDLAAGDTPSLGRRMTRVHELLRELTVSNERLDRLVDSALGDGALGAKLTGGGRGGCIIALAESAASAELLAARLTRTGAANAWIVTAEDSTDGSAA
jgi:mevalonate kinase